MDVIYIALAGVLAIVLAFLPLVAAVLVFVVGFRRIRGRRSGRLDRIADVTAGAMAAAIYPHSLRGGPLAELRSDQLVNEDLEPTDDGTPESHVRVMRRP